MVDYWPDFMYGAALKRSLSLYQVKKTLTRFITVYSALRDCKAR